MSLEDEIGKQIGELLAAVAYIKGSPSYLENEPAIAPNPLAARECIARAISKLTKLQNRIEHRTRIADALERIAAALETRP